MHPGKRLPHNSRVYLPQYTYKERKHDQVITAAERTKSCVEGIIGISPFSSTFDMVVSIPVDYMHCVLERLMRRLVNRWFDSKFHAPPFYISCHVREINLQLLQQRPPLPTSFNPEAFKILEGFRALQLACLLFPTSTFDTACMCNAYNAR